jgi:hypothetical protein
MPRSRAIEPTYETPDWSPEGARLERALIDQGRQTDWLVAKLGISRNYLYRMRLQPSNAMYRPPRDGLWQDCERLLGVPAGTIVPAEPVQASTDSVPLLEAGFIRRQQRRKAAAATA